MGDGNNSSISQDDFGYFDTKFAVISYEVFLPIIVSVGLVANVFAFCVWVFGPKSTSMCCAIYFAANSAVDFLLLTEPPLWNDGFRESSWLLDIPRTDFTCKLFYSMYLSCGLLSTNISAIITVERSLTVLFPLQFKCQGMKKRSKRVVTVIVVLQPFLQFVQLYYMKNEEGTRCTFTESWQYILYYNILLVFVMMVIPLIVIVVSNVATVATLSRERTRRHVVSGCRGHVSGFIKLTIMSGVSLVFSYTPICVVKVYELFGGIDSDFVFQILPLSHVLLYFNSLMNPVICFIVCKSIRDDIKHYLGVLTRMIRHSCICLCKSHQQEVQTTNMNNDTRGLEHIQLNIRDNGTGVTSTSRY